MFTAEPFLHIGDTMSSSRDNSNGECSQGDEIIELFHQFLAQSPSDFSITILPSTGEEAATTSDTYQIPSHPPLEYSIVLVDGHLGLDARALPWITCELRRAFKNLQKNRHYDKCRMDIDHGEGYNHDTTSAGAATAASKMIETTACLLLVNPDHATVWADRRRALLCTLDISMREQRTTGSQDRFTSSDERKTNHTPMKVWKDEIQYLDLMFTQHSKA